MLCVSNRAQLNILLQVINWDHTLSKKKKKKSDDTRGYQPQEVFYSSKQQGISHNYGRIEMLVSGGPHKIVSCRDINETDLKIFHALN